MYADVERLRVRAGFPRNCKRSADDDSGCIEDVVDFVWPVPSKAHRGTAARRALLGTYARHDRAAYEKALTRCRYALCRTNLG